MLTIICICSKMVMGNRKTLMNSFFTVAQLLFTVVLLFSCSAKSFFSGNQAIKKMDSTNSKLWNLTDLREWKITTPSNARNFVIEDGSLKIFSNPNTWERSKVKTISSFGQGTYSWKVYVPEMGEGDMASIGAFLYHDDKHELDFEIGYGSRAIRDELAAECDDLVVYMASQANPGTSVRKKIKRKQWYILSLELTLSSAGRYLVNWKINDTVMASASLNYGKRTKFHIYCSLENLEFMGDAIPQKQNYALFNSVEFKGV